MTEEQHQRHLDRIVKYNDKIAVKEALLRMWEQQPNPTFDDSVYMSELRDRIRKAKVLLSHIRP